MLEKLAVNNNRDIVKRGGINGEGTNGGSANLDKGL